MIVWFRSCVFILVIAVIASGSKPTVSGTPAVEIHRNEPLLTKGVCSQEGSAPRTAFFMTISGGGSRAAFFGARVISELKQVEGADLTTHLDAISAVSGGAMTAALYGISKDVQHGEAWRPVWDDNLVRERLTANLKISAAKQFANPEFLIRYVFGHKTRTDALLAVLDSDVLNASEKGRILTLGDMSTTRPQIIINSTVATQDDSDAFRPRPFGSLFTFTQMDLSSIGDDYSSMPISTAVAASAAFPGLLSPVVLNRFQKGSIEKALNETKYIHLIDGGAADNLGLLSIKRALIEDSHRILTECDQVVVLSVDAFGSQGEHRDDTPDMRSALGMVIDSNTLLSAFDSLLAASRTRVLAEFKSRMFTPPADSEQCRKDGLPYNDCIGGVRFNWDEINTLLKQKLFFVHISFDSDEVAGPPMFNICPEKDEKEKNINCEPPVNSYIYAQEMRALRVRLKMIPTTFGLTPEEVTDITTFTKLLFTPKNACLLHMRDMLLKGSVHNADFYMNASNSCDETTSSSAMQMSRRRGGSEVYGDVILSDDNIREEIKRRDHLPLTMFTTLKERDNFWNHVLMYYGWNSKKTKD